MENSNHLKLPTIWSLQLIIFWSLHFTESFACFTIWQESLIVRRWLWIQDHHLGHIAKGNFNFSLNDIPNQWLIRFLKSYQISKATYSCNFIQENLHTSLHSTAILGYILKCVFLWGCKRGRSSSWITMKLIFSNCFLCILKSIDRSWLISFLRCSGKCWDVVADFEKKCLFVEFK